MNCKSETVEYIISETEQTKSRATGFQVVPPDWQSNMISRSLITNPLSTTDARDVACRVASNYPFAKLMEIAESVPTGRVRQATKFKIFIISCVPCSDKRQFCRLSLPVRTHTNANTFLMLI